MTDRRNEIKNPDQEIDSRTMEKHQLLLLITSIINQIRRLFVNFNQPFLWAKNTSSVI